MEEIDDLIIEKIINQEYFEKYDLNFIMLFRLSFRGHFIILSKINLKKFTALISGISSYQALGFLRSSAFFSW